jgi:AraC-like DNA-binding protein
MGILNLKGGEKRFQLTRYDPSEDLAFFVKHYWVVSWDLTGQEPYWQEVVPNPCVNWVVDKGRTAFYGAAKTKYSHLLTDKGCVFGVKFRPGGFYPFIKQPVSGLTNCPMPVENVFGTGAATGECDILSQANEEQMVELAESLLRTKLPEKDETITLINRIIDRIAEDRELVKVDEICRDFDFNKRKLQRLFDQYVGVSPKWVIKLYRLQNAAETMDNGGSRDWTRLSMNLGYYDQSHFIKDFKATIGKTPDEYVKAQL